MIIKDFHELDKISKNHNKKCSSSWHQTSDIFSERMKHKSPSLCLTTINCSSAEGNYSIKVELSATKEIFNKIEIEEASIEYITVQHIQRIQCLVNFDSKTSWTQVLDIFHK